MDNLDRRKLENAVKVCADSPCELRASDVYRFCGEATDQYIPVSDALKWLLDKDLPERTRHLAQSMLEAVK